jgi:CDP-diacylglycerol--serine O-phosphatidyltransferase
MSLYPQDQQGGQPFMDRRQRHQEKRRLRRQHRRHRILQATAVLPSLATVFNALSGFGAIHFATKAGLGRDPLGTAENLRTAVGLVFVAMVFDMLDGRLARMTRRTSDFGAQLDSLSDMVSFGLAPAVIALQAVIALLHDPVLGFSNIAVERVVWCMTAVYVACAALRLARFNVENEPDESAHMSFKGLPSPGAAAAVVTLVLFYANYKLSGSLDAPWHLVVLAAGISALTLACALLMVSRFRYPHIVNQYVRGKRPFSYLVRLVIVLVAVLLLPWPTLAAVATLYALSGPVGALWRLWRKPHLPVR